VRQLRTLVFGRAVRRCEGGLEVADNEQFLPLSERTVSPAHRLIKRHLRHGAVDHGVRYRWRIDDLLEHTRGLGGVVFVVVVLVRRSLLLVTVHDGI